MPGRRLGRWLTMPKNPIARLRQREYWLARGKRESRRRERSGRLDSLRQQARESTQRGAIALELFVTSLPMLLTALSLYGLALLVGDLLSAVPLRWVAWFGTSVTDDTFRDLVGAGVGAIASLLGLFFATLGVVAATVYGSAPPSVRGLLFREPQGVAYVRGVVRAFIVGVCILTAGSIGADPTPLLLLMFAILCLNSILRLMVLGTRIFNFFDPTRLALDPSSRFLRAAKLASGSAARTDQGTQVASHRRARPALTAFDDLLQFMESRRGGTVDGPRRVADLLLDATKKYTDLKSRIPSQSEWWQRSARHENWLTLDATRLHVARASATSVEPKAVPDRLWVERQVAAMLNRSVRLAYGAGGTRAATAMSMEAAVVVQNMSVHLQMEEALLIHESWVDAMLHIVGSTQPNDAKDPFRAEAAEQTVLPLTYIWVGFVQGALRAAAPELVTLAHRGVADPTSIYDEGTYARVVETLEQFVPKLKAEKAAEGRFVTPDWWLEHFFARDLAHQLNASNQLMRTATESINGRAAEWIATADHDIAATASMAGLELYDLFRSNAGRLTAAFDLLASRRNENIDVAWPATPDNVGWSEGLRDRAWRDLKACLPHLRTERYDSSRRDLHGQAYQVLFEAAFESILAGSKELAFDLYVAIFEELDALRVRLAADLSEAEPIVQIRFQLGPILELLELGGYARLMQDVNGDGIWPTLQELWKRVLGVAPSEFAGRLVAALSVADSPMTMDVRISRTQREMQFRRLLDDRGIKRPDRRDHSPGDPTQSPIVRAFARDMSYADVADLFVVEMLLPYLAPDIELRQKTTSLMHELRIKREGTGGSDDEA